MKSMDENLVQFISIIGMLDTGIDPSHPSFSDEGMSLPPAKWNGHCEFTGQRTCNKIIGARTFFDDSKIDPLDNDGHGTHTASTAAGRPVQGANVFGNAKGTAIGMAPDAHLAIYKVCKEYSCPKSAVVAGRSVPFFDDTIAVGAFTAVENGIFISCAAGNGGPLFFFYF